MHAELRSAPPTPGNDDLRLHPPSHILLAAPAVYGAQAASLRDGLTATLDTAGAASRAARTREQGKVLRPSVGDCGNTRRPRHEQRPLSAHWPRALRLNAAWRPTGGNRARQRPRGLGPASSDALRLHLRAQQLRNMEFKTLNHVDWPAFGLIFETRLSPQRARFDRTTPQRPNSVERNTNGHRLYTRVQRANNSFGSEEAN